LVNLSAAPQVKRGLVLWRHRLSPRQVVKDVLAGGLIARLAEEEN
jgi:hypothetical protein